MTYGEMRKAKEEAMKSKKNQKLYEVKYNIAGFIESVLVLAASKKDARVLSGKTKIISIELA